VPQEPSNSNGQISNDAGASVEGQAAYWDANLAASNLGRDGEPIPPLDYETERRFFLGPEGAYALAALGNVRGKRVIDLGAGLGVAALMLAKAGARVVAVDIAPKRLEALARAAEELGVGAQVETLHAPAERLPLAEASVDAVFTKSVLIHTDLDAALTEVRRVLKPGGRIVFLEPMAHNPLANLYRRLLAPREWGHITRYFTEERVTMVRRTFPGLRERRFHLLGFGAFAFQFALRWPVAFQIAVGLTHAVDTVIFLLPFTRRLAWFTVMSAQRE